MSELLHRLAIAVLLISGALTAGIAALDAWALRDFATSGPLLHSQVMLGFFGLGLIVAAFIPSWRLPAVAVATVSNAAFLVISPGAAVLEAGLFLLLLVAAGVFGREAWQEARWNRMLPLRSEG
jgi:hypothetical protein